MNVVCGDGCTSMGYNYYNWQKFLPILLVISFIFSFNAEVVL